MCGAAASLVFIFLPTLLFAQSDSSCAGLHQGIFHYYPRHSSVHLYVRRDGDLQYENDDSNTDTTVWQIQWTGDCSYTEKYLSGSHTLTKKQERMLNGHVLAYKIVAITEDYFVVREYQDKISLMRYMETDTLWFHERLPSAGTQTFKRISRGDLLKSNFSDSSSYALVYLYRPGKLTNSLGSYPIYVNDSLLCIAYNRSGYIFKVRREGNYTLESRLYKDHSAVQLDIHFGKVYYVKSMVHWGITSRLYNFRLEMATSDPRTGATEFADVKLH